MALTVEIARQIGDADLLPRRAEAAPRRREAVDLAGDEKVFEARRLLAASSSDHISRRCMDWVRTCSACRVAFVHDAAQTVRLNVEIGQFEGCVEPLRIQHAVGGEVLQRRIEKRRHPFDPVGTAQHVDADHHLGGIGRIEERHEFGRLRCPAGLEQGDDDGAGKA